MNPAQKHMRTVPHAVFGALFVMLDVAGPPMPPLADAGIIRQAFDFVRVHVVVHKAAAQPPSTGKSTPVNWRDTSLARNRQAFATSASVLIRFSA